MEEKKNVSAFFLPSSKKRKTHGNNGSITGRETQQHRSISNALSQLRRLLGEDVDCDALLRDSFYSLEKATDLFFTEAGNKYKRKTDSSACSTPAEYSTMAETLNASNLKPLSSSPPLSIATSNMVPEPTNALALLCSNARIPKRVEVFSLIEDSHGLLRWSWLCRQPIAEDGTWQRLISVKEKGKVNNTELWLCTNICPAENWDASFDSVLQQQVPFTGLPVSTLKSMLQKNVRRRRSVAALRVAFELARLDYAQFVRRLCVIIIEDALLHPAFPLLVWLMLVDSKFHGDFPVPSHIIVALLSIVEETATTTLRDDFVEQENDDNITMTENNGRRLADKLDSSLSCDESTKRNTKNEHLPSILRSIVVRATYGGMRCDVSMFYAAASLWLGRFVRGGDDSFFADAQRCLYPAASSSSDSVAKVKAVKPKDSEISCWYLDPIFVSELRLSSPWMAWLIDAHVEPMRAKIVPEIVMTGRARLESFLSTSVRKGDVLPAGLDFHVWPTVTSAIITFLHQSSDSEDRMRAKRLEATGGENIKKAMWACSSGINFRKFLSTGIAESSFGLQNDLLRGVWNLMAETHRKLASRRLSSYKFAV